MEAECLKIRIYGNETLPTLVYLPGLHGDWTLISSFRAAVAGKARFVEFTYPRNIEWSLEDYAIGVEQSLIANGINNGWLLAESFGSQVAWTILGRQMQEARMMNLRENDECRTSEGTGMTSREGSRRSSYLDQPSSFDVSGLVLAGGFVKHPWPWGALFLRRLGIWTPLWLHRMILKGYEVYSHFRHRHALETKANIREFTERRTLPDRRAMWARLRLVANSDPRMIARQTSIPVHYVAGLVDPLVPWPIVRWWLRRECPTYRGGLTCWKADHNVLATAPALAGDAILNWMKRNHPRTDISKRFSVPQSMRHPPSNSEGRVPRVPNCRIAGLSELAPPRLMRR